MVMCLFLGIYMTMVDRAYHNIIDEVRVEVYVVVAEVTIFQWGDIHFNDFNWLTHTGWWFVVFFLHFLHLLGIIIPNCLSYFSEG